MDVNNFRKYQFDDPKVAVRLARHLEEAISGGNALTAASLAKQLAKCNIQCSVIIKQQEQKLPKELAEFELTIADERAHIGFFSNYKLDPSFSIKFLKKTIEDEFNYPANLQIWIVNNKLIINDDVTLSSINEGFGTSIFIYLNNNDASQTKRYKETFQLRQDLVRNLCDFDREAASDFTGYKDTSTPKHVQETHVIKPTGWVCGRCTLINFPTRPGCLACTNPRPTDYIIPSDYKLSPEEREMNSRQQETEAKFLEEQQKQAKEHYETLLTLDEVDIVVTEETFECNICFSEVDSGDGVRFRECFHTFCKECIANFIKNSEGAVLRCPYRADNFSCQAVLEDREIRALVIPEVYSEHLRKSLLIAESQCKDTFHCQTPDCIGWCFYENKKIAFFCPVCMTENCINCSVQHQGMNCREFQEMLVYNSPYNVNLRKTKEILDEMLVSGAAMRCPTCQVIITKNGGCNHMHCTMCNKDFQWQPPRTKIENMD